VKGTTKKLSGANIYQVKRDELVASAMFTDIRNQSEDYSLVLMLDPKANHSFVYYAVSINFVGDYLQSMHFNDESFFAVTALANNTIIRIAPNQKVNVSNVMISNNTLIRATPDIAGYINDVMIPYGEEYIMTLDLGEALMISSSEDLTGTRVTSNKATIFYSGHHCAGNKTVNCSILTEQIPPYNSWGNSFILHTNISNLRGNMFKIIASDAGANVTVTCTTTGSNYEVRNFNLVFRQHTVISIAHDYCTVDSNENILIIQFKDSSQLLQDTFMTIIPALDHFQTQYVFNTYTTFDSYVVLTVKNTNPNTDSLLLNNNPVTLAWESVEINKNTYYFGTLFLSANRHTLEFSRTNIKFGAIIYGLSENNIDTYALSAGLALDVNENLPIQGTYIYLYTHIQIYIPIHTDAYSMYVTGFGKTFHVQLKSILLLIIIATQQLFADPAKPQKTKTDPVGPLMGINRVAWVPKLFH